MSPLFLKKRSFREVSLQSVVVVVVVEAAAVVVVIAVVVAAVVVNSSIGMIDQHTRELISARKTSHENNNKDLSCPR